MSVIDLSAIPRTVTATQMAGAVAPSFQPFTGSAGFFAADNIAAYFTPFLATRTLVKFHATAGASYDIFSYSTLQVSSRTGWSTSPRRAWRASARVRGRCRDRCGGGYALGTDLDLGHDGAAGDTEGGQGDPFLHGGCLRVFLGDGFPRCTEFRRRAARPQPVITLGCWLTVLAGRRPYPRTRGGAAREISIIKLVTSVTQC
jgi:hypothetical protein